MIHTQEERRRKETTPLTHNRERRLLFTKKIRGTQIHIHERVYIHIV